MENFSRIITIFKHVNKCKYDFFLTWGESWAKPVKIMFSD